MRDLTTMKIIFVLLLLVLMAGCLDDKDKGTSKPASENGRYQVIGDQGQYVRDRITGLEWQRCPVTETWDAKTNSCTGQTPRMTWNDANNYKADAGFRLPTLLELNTLVYCWDNLASPRLERPSMQPCQLNSKRFTQDSSIFPETSSENWFWTSSSTQNRDRAYYINFVSGATGHEPHTSTLNVRLVRGQMESELPDSTSLVHQQLLDGRFLTTGSEGERLLDLETGYEWYRCPVGKTWQAQDGLCTGTAEYFTFEEARDYAQENEVPGGFRTPRIAELQTLILCRLTNGQVVQPQNGSCPEDQLQSLKYPAISPAFPETASDYWYWSATSLNYADAQFVDLGLGKTALANPQTQLRIRLMRTTRDATP